MALIITKDIARANADRLLTRVKPSGDGCWLWQGAKQTTGYGHLSVSHNGRKYQVSAHRFSYVLHHDEIPPGMVIMHKCDRPSCVNPTHLLVGTQAENLADMVRKGRMGTAPGMLHPFAKITDDDVRAIRRLAAAGVSQRELGRRFGIHNTVVCRIVRRERWTHVA